MSAAFGPRRKVKVVGQEDTPATSTGDEDTGPTVKRPSRPKPRTSRVSFAPAGEEEDEPISVVKPKRGLGRKSGLASSTTADRLASRDLEEEDGKPSYSKEALAELRDAQRSRPAAAEAESKNPFSRELDVANKFGRTLASYEAREGSSLIPTDAEIQEKKARRARMAKMAKYNIQSDDSDAASGDERPNSDEDEFLTQRDKVSLRDAQATRSKEPETRLVRDDEDFMEGLEAFTGEDSRVALGEGAQREARTKHRSQIRDMIDAAQQDSADEESEGDEDDEDRDMRSKFEANQTRKGLESLRVDGSRSRQHSAQDGARTPPRITPIPTLSSCVERLRGKLLEIEADRAAKQRRMEELAAEKKDIAQREIDIQRLLAETAEKYERLSREAGLSIELPASSALNDLRLEGQASVPMDTD